MRERRDQLKGEVCRMFEDEKAMSMADTVKLVDTLQRLGIDNHFIKDIDEALYCVHDNELEFANSNDLHVVALQFRLLRQHGFWVSAGKYTFLLLFLLPPYIHSLESVYHHIVFL